MVAGPRLLVSAPEPSGDMHAGPVVAELLRQQPDARVEALGGPEVRAAGAQVRWKMEDYSAFGLAEVLGAIPRHARLLAEWKRAFETRAWDLVVLVDYPGFHLRVAEAAKRAGLPVLYYVAPQLWGWRPGRAARLARGVDRLAVILPFEAEYFERLGIPATFVGHPLMDGPPWPTRLEARTRLGVGAGERVVAIFPGSRAGEVRRLWVPMRDAARRLLASGQAGRVLVAATDAGGEYHGAADMDLWRREPRSVMAAADVVLAKSGTTTLECAIADAPMVVAYTVHPVTAAIARRLVKVPYVSLANLVAGREVVPELLQGAVTADRLVEAAAPLLEPGSAAAAEQRAGFAEVRRRLGGPGAARRVAELAVALVGP
jgi:lipid-A-disaccharide synthase